MDNYLKFVWLRQRLCIIARISWVLLAASIALLSASVNGQEKKWLFEIEVLLFKRDLNPNTIKEQFVPGFTAFKEQPHIDLLTDYLIPDLTWTRDSLPYCFKPPAPPPEIPDIVFMPDALLSDVSLGLDQMGVKEILKEVVIADPLYPQIQTIEQVPGLELFQMTPEEGFQVPEISDDTDIVGNAENETVEVDEFGDEVYADSEFELNFEPVLIRMPTSIACVFEDEQLQFTFNFDENPEPEVALTEVPQTISNVEWFDAELPYLLSKNSLQLSELASNIARQSNTSPLLHVGWRQEVLVGQDIAPFFRLFGGQNFALNYDATGAALMDEPQQEEYPLPIDPEKSTEELEQPNLIDQIKRALADPYFVIDESAQDQVKHEVQQRVPELWELDGLFKVFLRYIQNVPYLHIESQLDFRAPASDTPSSDLDQSTLIEEQQIPLTRLQNFQFSQVRRVISKQMHYFDHPLFGMVVQIRRFEQPQREDAANANEPEEAKDNQ